MLVLGAQLLKGPHRQPPREKPSAHGPPQPVTLGTPGSPAEPPHVRAVSPAATATPGTTHAKCGGGITFESLQLNQAAQELWGCWGNGSDVPAVMLTFGSHSMADFLLNWLEHVKRLDQRLYLVGALDQRMEQLCAKHRIPAATIKPSAMAANGILSSVGQLGQSSGQYYRYAAGTFLRMGLVKEVFIRSMLDAGLDAMVSDVDVAWLSSPWPLVRYPEAAARPSAALLALADVILSVDQVQQYMDSDKYQWHIHSELNTGVIFFRNSEGARGLGLVAEAVRVRSCGRVRVSYGRRGTVRARWLGLVAGELALALTKARARCWRSGATRWRPPSPRATPTTTRLGLGLG